jgi:hypothetical protein
MSAPARARTYNQSHITRPHTGGRRISIYWRGATPGNPQSDPAEMYNRFSTMTEVRSVLWPSYETAEYDAANFLQGIAGTLELFHRSHPGVPGAGGGGHRASRCGVSSHRPSQRDLR